MSYRRFWRKYKYFFPNVYCVGMTDSFRIVKDKNDPAMYAEFYSLGNGRTRYDAWKDASSWVAQAPPVSILRRRNYDA